MSMSEWAKREVEIACKKERGDNSEDEWDYGCACYESALRAFENLMKDGHSGYSISMTKHILNCLIEGKPLTPIEDTADVWDDGYWSQARDCTSYQCKRMSSLFKNVYADGTVRYRDIKGHYCINIRTNIAYYNGFVQTIIDELFPITMPYYPGDPIKVYCEELLTDFKNGDFDTIGILYAVRPDGEKVHIYRYFKESDNSWEEITAGEYNVRKYLDRKRTMVDD